MKKSPTGRLSKKEPQPQQIPLKTEEAKQIREALIPERYPSTFGPGGEVSIDWLAYNHRRNK